jgi:eukaryotic-like serine/threonine-protein kinase
VLAQDALLGDRYRLTSRIAIGGMGEVWRAEDMVLNRTVAVKVLKSELTSDPTFLARFRAEARTTAALSHPGIANVFDYGEAVLGGPGGLRTAYLVMEHVEGEPLSAILAREVRLIPPRTLDIVRQAATALEVAHRTGMVHRDVKPGNLLVRPDGVVKVTDFGIARVTDAVPLTQSGMVVGTAQYFSPEQAEGRAVTAASDVYSLGVVAYECLAGRLPFVADTAVAVALMQIREVPPPLPGDVPPAVRELIARAMAKDPRQRYGTGGEFAAAVRAVQERPYDDPTTVVPVPLGTGPAPGPVPGPAGGVGATGTRLLPSVPGGVPPLGGGMAGTGASGPPAVGAGGRPTGAPPGTPGGPSALGVPAAPRPTGGGIGQLPAGTAAPPPAYPARPASATPPGRPGPPGPPVRSGPLATPATPYRSTPRWPVWLATVLVILIIAAGVVTLLLAHRNTGGGNPGSGRPQVSQSAGQPSRPSGGAAGGAPGATGPAPGGSSAPARYVAVQPADYVGQDRDIVLAELQQLGLRTRLVDTQQASAALPGTVLKISPSGPAIPVGTVINVFAIPKDRGRNR